MDTLTVIRSLWEQIDARNWDGLHDLLAPQVQIHWPASREIITGRESFVAVQAEYPDGWSIELLDAIAAGGRGATEVQVPFTGGEMFRVSSWWTVENGLITAGTEYWISIGQDESPQWRQPYVTLQH